MLSKDSPNTLTQYNPIRCNVTWYQPVVTFCMLSSQPLQCHDVIMCSSGWHLFQLSTMNVCTVPKFFMNLMNFFLHFSIFIYLLSKIKKKNWFALILAPSKDKIMCPSWLFDSFLSTDRWVKHGSLINNVAHYFRFSSLITCGKTPLIALAIKVESCVQ